jgi:hypothetical protein
MPLDYSFLDECVHWPAAAAGKRPTAPKDAVYPDIPALIISGELDDITTPADGAAVAAAFPRGTQVLIANSFHVNALPRARSTCGAAIVRRFVTSLAVARFDCAGRVPPLRLVSQFVLHAAGMPPAQASPGNRADDGQLRIAAVAVATAGDVAARVDANVSGRGAGLRGGEYHTTRLATGAQVRLEAVRWTDDVAATGTLFQPLHHTGTVHAELDIKSADPRGCGLLRIDWPDGVGNANARIRGLLGGVAVEAGTAAP